MTRIVPFARLALAGALCAALATAGTPQAEPEPVSWAQQLSEAQERIDAARQREAEAEASYTRARHDRHPRGEALSELRQAWDAARQERQAAEAALPELLEEARRAGAPPADLRPWW